MVIEFVIIVLSLWLIAAILFKIASAMNRIASGIEKLTGDRQITIKEWDRPATNVRIVNPNYSQNPLESHAFKFAWMRIKKFLAKIEDYIDENSKKE